MRLALWQGCSPCSDIEAALSQAEIALAAAGAMGADALVLPEIWLPGYNQPITPTNALDRNDAAFRRLGKAAAHARCALVIGYAESDEDRVYNSALCLGPDGEPLANYRKIQVFGPREAAIYQPGETYLTFPLAGVTAAIQICYDVEFAPHVKALSDKGAKVILVPTANMQPYVHVIRATVPAMAANHAVTIAYANYCGVEGDLIYLGGSLIAGPHGEVVAQAGETPALLIADIPLRRPQYLSTQASDLRVIE